MIPFLSGQNSLPFLGGHDLPQPKTRVQDLLLAICQLIIDAYLGLSVNPQVLIHSAYKAGRSPWAEKQCNEDLNLKVHG